MNYKIWPIIAGSFSAMYVSHELKTPIFNIQGYILTLLDGGLKDKTINKKFLFRISKKFQNLNPGL